MTGSDQLQNTQLSQVLTESPLVKDPRQRYHGHPCLHKDRVQQPVPTQPPPPTAPAHTQRTQPTEPGLMTTASTQPGNPPTLLTAAPLTGSYANAVTGFTAQRASTQPDLQEKVPVYLNPAMAKQLSAILADASRQPAPITQ